MDIDCTNEMTWFSVDDLYIDDLYWLIIWRELIFFSSEIEGLKPGRTSLKIWGSTFLKLDCYDAYLWLITYEIWSELSNFSLKSQPCRKLASWLASAQEQPIRKRGWKPALVNIFASCNQLLKTFSSCSSSPSAE